MLITALESARVLEAFDVVAAHITQRNNKPWCGLMLEILFLIVSRYA